MLSITEKINKGFLAPTTFFVIIVFYLLRSLLANPNPACNPFILRSTYFVSILDILLVVISGYWMAYRIHSEPPKEALIDPEKKEEEKTENVELPDEGKHD